jgi:hypothetical protein
MVDVDLEWEVTIPGSELRALGSLMLEGRPRIVGVHELVVRYTCREAIAWRGLWSPWLSWRRI